MSRNAIGGAAVSDRWTFVWLGIGTVLFAFANGRWIVPAATWFSLVFLLRFMRTQTPIRGFVALYTALVLASTVSWYIPSVPLPIMTLQISIFSLFISSYFLLDRFVSPRLPGSLPVLALPLIWTTGEFLISKGPLSTWGSLAYTQFGNLPLMQVVSITGQLGITFQIVLFASFANWMWERGFVWHAIRRSLISYTVIVSSVLLAGGARLALFPPSSDTVRVASMLTPEAARLWNEYGHSRTLPSMEDNVNIVGRSCEYAANAGAVIALWQEYGLFVRTEDEKAFVQRCGEIAKDRQLYVMLTMGVLPSEPGRHGENKAVLIGPSGEVRLEHVKNLIAPIESPYVMPGDGGIQTLDAPFGTVAPAICFELNSPQFVRQAGKKNVDILLAPSLVLPESSPLATRMHVFRAVENGLSLICCTGEGVSMAVDHQGRIRSYLDPVTTTETVMISDVPTKRVRTVYVWIGDAFAWVNVAGLLVLMVTAWRGNEYQNTIV